MSDVDMQRKISAIRESILSSVPGAPAAEQPFSTSAAGTPFGVDLGRLREMSYRVRRAEKLVGRLPAQPPGFRARIGAVLVRLVQRMLFWYTPQITAFHSVVAEVADAQILALTEVDRTLKALRSEVEFVRSKQGATPRMEDLEARIDAAVDGSSRLLGVLTETEHETIGFRIDAIEENIRRLEEAVKAADQRGLEARVSLALERSSGLETALDLAQRNLAQVKTDLIGQDRRLSILLQEAARRLPDPLSDEQLRVLSEEDRSHLDALYVAFEETFRGARTLVKQRLQVYIPILQEAGLGRTGTPVIDLGCGRGEWLEVLAEHGLCGRGLDVNRAMIGQCETVGVTAFHADALTYLRGMPASSVGVVTAFHVLEHMPFRQVVDLLDETVRVLKPGGIAIFETPDPSNTSVGSHTFYLDPTHRNPLPSAALQFIAEARGLFQVKVMHLHPYPPEHLIPDDDRGFAQRFNQLFYGPQDYAIIGRKI